MSRGDVGALLLLAALWGASFLFMRMGAAEFGPLALSALRVAIAAACLLPLLALHPGGLAALRRHAGALAWLGLLNSALPFALVTFALLTLGAGLAAIFNASSPMWGALAGQLWFGQRMTRPQQAGLAIGFGGVCLLAWARAGGGLATARGDAGAVAVLIAIAACLAAAASYGYAANHARRALHGVPPLASAAGSQLFATLMLAAPGAAAWPAQTPGLAAWLALAALGVLCTAAAYLLYFRLIARAGADKAISVTYLVPMFALAWGAIFLGERIDAAMLASCAAILIGTALATGLLGRRRAAPAG